jgi:hypothetical protein
MDAGWLSGTEENPVSQRKETVIADRGIHFFIAGITLLIDFVKKKESR